MTPIHAQENLEGAGRTEGASRFTTLETVINLRSRRWGGYGYTYAREPTTGN